MDNALFFYRQAAVGGDAKAQSTVGKMYETGRFVLKNSAEAMEWYRKSANQGYPQGGPPRGGV